MERAIERRVRRSGKWGECLRLRLGRQADDVPIGIEIPRRDAPRLLPGRMKDVRARADEPGVDLLDGLDTESDLGARRDTIGGWPRRKECEVQVGALAPGELGVMPTEPGVVLRLVEPRLERQPDPIAIELQGLLEIRRVQQEDDEPRAIVHLVDPPPACDGQYAG